MMNSGNGINGSQFPIELSLDGAESGLSMEQTFQVLREKAWLIALFTVIGIFAGLAYLHRIPLTYYSRAVLKVDAEPVKMVDIDQSQPAKDPISEEMGQTFLAIFQSRDFLRQIIESSQLLKDPDFLLPEWHGRAPSIETAIDAVMGMERVEIRKGTRFLDVGAQHPNPLGAKKVADALADGLIRHTMEQQTAIAKVKIDYLLDEAAKLKDKVQRSEMARENYIEKNNAISLQERQDTVVAELKNQSNQLGTTRATRMRLETDDEEAQKHLNDPNALLQIPSVANHPTIMDLKQQISTLEGKISTLNLRYTEKHPKMIQAMVELADAKQALRDDVQKIPPVIHSAYLTALANEQKFASALAEQEKVAMVLNKQSIEYGVLSRDVETDQALYESILKDLKQARVAAGVESTNIHIYERAIVPSEPVHTAKARILALSILGGLLVGSGVSFGANALDSSIKSVDQAERVTNLRVMAAVPRASRRDMDGSNSFLVTQMNSPVAEAFRSLRTTLFLAGREKGRKVVLFTSALASEGKTFCSVNYAAMLAQQGLRTLLIDADLRAPSVSCAVFGEERAPGLVDLLHGVTRLDDSIHSCSVENLSILPVGEIVSNPAELLAAGRFGELIKALSARFDRIVIDTAPVTAVSDTLLLVEYVQSVCLVAKAAKTPRKWILRASKLLSTDARPKVLGLILNQVPMANGAYSYYPGRYGRDEVYGTLALQNAASSSREPRRLEAARDEPRFRLVRDEKRASNGR